MTTRRRALVHAGVVITLVIGVLAVAFPAYADSVGVTVTSQFVPFNPGGAQPLKITVTNGGAPSVTVSVSGLTNFAAGNAQGCDRRSGSSCTITFGAGDTSKDISFTLTATGTVAPGQSKTDHGTVSARQNVLLGSGATAAFDVTLNGPQQTHALPVARVSGIVRDMTTGSPIPNAVVVLVDAGACAAGNQPCQASTDNNGVFTFASTPDKPITPGTLQARATKNGYDDGTVTVAAQAGQSVTVSLALKPTAAANSSASPEALPSADGQQPTANAVAPTAAAVAPASAGGSAPSALSWIVLVFAGLLVVLGVGVFVILFFRRGKGDTPDDTAGYPPFGPGDATTGAGVDGDAAGAADPTVPASAAMTSAMASPGAGDPTAVIGPRRPGDEFPDPRAAAYPTSPTGYPQAGKGYGAPSDPYATQVAGYGSGQPAGYEPVTHGYGGAYWAYGQGGDYDYGAGYSGPPTAYSPGQRYGSGDDAHEATRHSDDDTGGGYTGGADYPRQGDYAGGYGQQQHGGHRLWTGSDRGYPQDQRGGGYDPYQQQHPTETANRRGAPHADQDGDRKRLDWFGN